jgi:hypothetical protein
MPTKLNEEIEETDSDDFELNDEDEDEVEESADLEDADAPDQRLVKLSEEEEALLPDDALRARAEARKPDISSLRSAIDPNGDFIPRKGDYVVIERRQAHFANNAWLDTRVYRLTKDPAPNGDLTLWDPVRMQCAFSNWLVGRELNFDFRLPPAGRNPETCLESGGKRRKKKKLLGDKPAPVPSATPDGKKRGRGRPPGAKNRPKDVVQAEKKARQEERRAKKAARVARKLSK